jgi:hypothetical protein
LSDGDFLSRWSRRKHEARRQDAAETKVAPAPAPPPIAPASDGSLSASPASAVPVEPAEPAPLPPIESLTPESDFTPFMRPNVDPNVRQQALKTLFQDARHNVMDGLDVYIDDYTKADPLPEGWLEKMEAVARLGVYRPPAEPDPEEVPKPDDAEEVVEAEAPALAAEADEPPELLNTVPEDADLAAVARREPQEGGT